MNFSTMFMIGSTIYMFPSMYMYAVITTFNIASLVAVYGYKKITHQTKNEDSSGDVRH